MDEAAAARGRVRALGLGLPETSERLSHGDPTSFIRGKRSFVSFANHHHGDGRLAVCCAAPDRRHGGRRPPRMGANALIAVDPARYFAPPYVAHLGWVGVRLEGAPDWEEIAGVTEDAGAVRRQGRS